MIDQMNGAVMVADLSDGVPNDTAVLHTVFPGTNKRTGWDIILAGPGHPKTISLNNEAERKRLLRAAQIERAQVNQRKWKGDEDKQPEESRKEFVEGLVGRIVTWSPIKLGAETIEFSEGAAVELLLRPQMGGYVAQIVEALIDERTFMKDSANS